MMNRIERAFKQLAATKQKAFLAFVTAGNPSLEKTYELVLAFEQAGVDLVELGVPFSDPMADGPTIQASSQAALERGVTLAKILDLVRKIRTRSQIPIALMTYYNPVHRFGVKKFVDAASRAGVDGVIIPDLPPEEAGELIANAKSVNFSTVFFLAPTTTHSRVKKIVQAATGFIYYVSLTGVTGAKNFSAQEVFGNIRAAKRVTRKPICVGFGIGNARQAREIAQVADGVIVGSAIIKEIDRYRGKKELVNQVARFVKQMVSAVKNRG